MFAISTSWNASRRFSTDGLLTTLSEFGVPAIELSYRHTAAEVGEIYSSCRKRGIGIAAVHNFCPFPDAAVPGRSASEILLLSSLDEEERRAAVEATRRSIGTAAAVGAGVLIIHLGRVEIPDRTGELISLHRRGMGESPACSEIREICARERKKEALRHLQRALKSIEELCAEASGAGVQLALENRFYHRELPSPPECVEIIHKLEGAPLCYWHDIGHAQVMEDLGFWSQDDYLKILGGSLRGLHIHDVSRFEDHLPPGEGDVDFARFRAFWRPEVLKVIELSPDIAPDAVARGIESLKKSDLPG